MLAWLLACDDPVPARILGAATQAPTPLPDPPCPLAVEERWVVGRFPVRSTGSSASEDYAVAPDRVVYPLGRIASVAVDGEHVWVATRDGRVQLFLGRGGEPPRNAPPRDAEPDRAWGTRSAAVAVDAKGGVAWAATADGEVLRLGPEGVQARFEVDGRPVAIQAAGAGAWVRDVDAGWHPVGAPGPRDEAPDPELPEANPVVALFAGGFYATDAHLGRVGEWRHTFEAAVVTAVPEAEGWRVITATDGDWHVGRDGRAPVRVREPLAGEIVAAAEGARVTEDGAIVRDAAAPDGQAADRRAPDDGAPAAGDGWRWQPPRAVATRDGWVAIGYGQMGRLELLGPAGERRVHALPGPVEVIGAALPGSALRWGAEGLWVPMPGQGLARLAAPDAAVERLPGVPGAWDVAPWEGGHVVALGEAGVGVLANGVLIGRCPLPGRVVRVDTGDGKVWAASASVVTRLGKALASRESEAGE